MLSQLALWSDAGVLTPYQPVNAAIRGLYERRLSDRLIDNVLYCHLRPCCWPFCLGPSFYLLQGVNPLEAYSAMVVGAFGSKNGLADTLVKAVPLMLVGLGIAIAFRGGVINIGAEGQLIVGRIVYHLRGCPTR